MPTLYFSYSLGGGSLDAPEPLNAPYTITWHVGRMLRDRASEHGYDFQFINLDSVEPVEFAPGDVAIGHLWDTPGSFMQQALNADIQAKVILQPYSHGMVSAGDVPRYIEMFLKANELLFITGEYWHSTMPDSPFAPLYDKTTRVDMAVSTALHPYQKTRWNPPGERAVCVIGNDTPTKGYRHVAELARVAGFRLGHFGNCQPETFAHVPCMVLHGGMMFTPDNVAKLCSLYDAVAVIAEADANPTILLEAASWGLSVFCNREAGYLPNQPFNELRLNDMAFNVGMMRAFQREDEYTLARAVDFQRARVERDYTFDKMTRTIWSKVEAYL
jgi:hypothetical protein